MTQAEKAYGKDWAKAKSRDLVRRMIGDTLLHFRRPKDLRVLCFPGVDAAEIYQVYDPLGIPRGNIVGVERDKDVITELERKKLGIRIMPMSLEEYVTTCEDFNFDILSLDYTGPFSNVQERTMATLLGSSRKNHLVLHCANLIRRDRQSIIHYASAAGDIDKTQPVLVPGMNMESLFIETDSERSGKISEAISKMCGGISRDSKDCKSSAYPYLLQRIYWDPEGSEFTIDRTLRFILGESYASFVHNFKDFCKKSGMEIDEGAPITSAIRKYWHLPILNDLEYNIAIRLKRQWQDLNLDDSDLFASILLGLLDAAVKPGKFYIEKDLDAYSYISESGSPMIGEVAFLSYPERSTLLAQEIARDLGYPDKKLTISNPISLLMKMQKQVAEFEKFSRNTDQTTIREKMESVHYLGCSSRPVLTKRLAIEEFRRGLTVDQVKEKYRGCGPKPLAQWKAHVTMGTYGETTPQSEETLEEAIIQEENGDLERITKEEAVDLLQSGIPVEEIYACYPSSFTRGQLRAFKAHYVTMGKKLS
ncbi:MAG TPA: hypothetical protein VJC07_02720 [Candidatus Nanoarchaeia archaeon]|nr:hypothetical protein [Candidatus Nanoarchaeia archaeon]